MKKHKKEEKFFEELRRVPNISSVCEAIGISRNTVYRWREEDKSFRARMDKALEMGTESVNDLAEGKIITSIKGGNLGMSKYWLENHKKNYMHPKPKDYLSRIFAEQNDGKGSLNPTILELLEAVRLLKEEKEAKDLKDPNDSSTSPSDQ